MELTTQESPDPCQANVSGGVIDSETEDKYAKGERGDWAGRKLIGQQIKLDKEINSGQIPPQW